MVVTMEEDTVMRGDELACNAAHVSVPRKPKRVAAACDRCRRQKLRVGYYLLSVPAEGRVFDGRYSLTCFLV